MQKSLRMSRTSGCYYPLQLSVNVTSVGAWCNQEEQCTGWAQQRSVLHGVASGHTDTVCTLCNVPSSATSHHSQLLPSDCIDIEDGLTLDSIVSPNSTISSPAQHKVTSCRQVCRWYGDGMRRLCWDPPDNCGWWPGNFHPVLASDPQFWLVLDTGDWTFKPVAGGAGAGPVATGHSNRVAPCADPGSCPQPPS